MGGGLETLETVGAEEEGWLARWGDVGCGVGG